MIDTNHGFFYVISMITAIKVEPSHVRLLFGGPNMVNSSVSSFFKVRGATWISINSTLDTIKETIKSSI